MGSERLVWALASAAGSAVAGLVALASESLLFGVTAVVLALAAVIVTAEG